MAAALSPCRCASFRAMEVPIVTDGAKVTVEWKAGCGSLWFQGGPGPTLAAVSTFKTDVRWQRHGASTRPQRHPSLQDGTSVCEMN